MNRVDLIMLKIYAYSFTTTWKIKAAIKPIWDAIYDAENWPQWWDCVKEASIIKNGDNRNIGMTISYQWKSFLPFTLNFCMQSVKLEQPNYMEGTAYGDLEGKGCWYINEVDGITTLQCEWHVNTNKTWMNKAAFLLKPFFKWNHNYAMKKGAKGLAKMLNAELIQY